MSEYNTFANALNIAGAIHRTQVRKGQIDGRDVSYLIHPVKVALTVSIWTQNNYRAMAIAILHDVYEDSTGADLKYAKKKIKELGKDIDDSVKILTKLKGDSYEKYIQKIADSGNLTCVMVKIADIFANMNDTDIFFGKPSEKIIGKAEIIFEKFSEVVARNANMDKASMYYMRMALVGLEKKIASMKKDLEGESSVISQRSG